MEAQLEAIVLKEYVAAINAINPAGGCAGIQSTKDGFHTLATDMDHVMQVDVTLLLDAFKKYDFENVCFGHDVEVLREQLKSARKGNTAVLSTRQLPDNYGYEGNLLFRGKNTPYVLETDLENWCDYQFKYHNYIFLPTKKLYSAVVKGRKLGADYISLTFDKAGILTAETHSMPKKTMLLRHKAKESTVYGPSASSVFSEDYLEQLLGAIKTPCVGISLGDNFPLQLKSHLKNHVMSTLIYHLAPLKEK